MSSLYSSTGRPLLYQHLIVGEPFHLGVRGWPHDGGRWHTRHVAAPLAEVICHCVSAGVELCAIPNTESVGRMDLRITRADVGEGMANEAESSSLSPDPDPGQQEQQV